MEQAAHAGLVELTEDMWRELENTDSFDIQPGGWEKVAEHINYTNKETGAKRDWEGLKQAMEQGKRLDAPIVLRHAGQLHKVSGNTRLMVARALGIRPKVLLVEM